MYGDTLGVPVLHGVGGSFDVLAGVTRRAPRSWQALGLEWAYRLVQEPRRLWKRYLRTNTHSSARYCSNESDRAPCDPAPLAGLVTTDL